MKRLAIFFVGALVIFLVGAFALLWAVFRVSYPPQPKFGFTGNWRTTAVFGFKEHPLPPATNVWQDYTAWEDGATNQNVRRVYLAQLGGATNQWDFRSSHSRGDTPMGAQWYTHVGFTYTDPTNGIYILSWTLRGKHDGAFLRFNNTFRLYQLQPYGTPGEYPPRLAIIAIEGIRPEHYREQ
jgi:hypothetical protein